MSTDLDDRLTDLLTRSATAVDVQPDLDAVLAQRAAPGAPVVDLGHRPGTVRRRLALAAAVLVLAGLATTAVLARHDDPTLDQATAPVTDARSYPVAEVLPSEVADEPWIVTAQRGVLLGPEGMAPPAGRAVLGTRAADGSLVDVDLILLGRPGAQPFDEVPGADLLVGGRRARATTTDRRTTVLVEGDPMLQIEGSGDLMGRLAQIPDGGIETGWDGERPTLALAGGPEIVVPAGPFVEGAFPTLTAGAFGTRSVTVSTDVDEPIAGLALTGADAMEPVDIAGSPGFHVPAPDGGQVAWTTPDGTNVVVRVEGLDADDVLAVARGVRLVDRTTWMDTYDQHGPPLGPAEPTTHPLVGRRVPTLPGVTDQQAAGRGLVLGFSEGDCDGCTRVDVVLVDLSRPDWAPLGFVWDSEGDSIVAAGRHDLLASQDLDAAQVTTDWGLTELPSTVVAGPDLIVRAVLAGGTDADTLEAALRDAQAAAGG